MTERFEAYCRRKTDAALAAELPGFETVSAPAATPADMVAIGNAWSRRLFDGWFYRRSCRDQRRLPDMNLVFVESADGNTVAEDPGELGGGDTDKHLVYEGLSRVDADAVLAGSKTAAGSDTVFSVWHPELVSLRASLGRPRHPAQVVVTARGHLPLHTALLYSEPSLRVIVVSSTRGARQLAPQLADRPWVEVIDAGSPLDVSRGIRELHRRGIAVISAVGGRQTAGAMLRAGIVAELYVTTAPGPGGEPGTPLTTSGLPPHRVLLEKRGRSREAGVRFRHFVFEPPTRG